MAMIGRSRLILDQLISKAASLGIFTKVNGHEPKSAPNAGLICSVWLDSLMPDPSKSGLAITSARLVYMIRIQKWFITDPVDGIDPDILDAVDLFIDALSGDLDLGSNALDVDMLGQGGDPLSARAGYINQDNKIYRLMEITVPILLDDVWAQVS